MKTRHSIFIQRDDQVSDVPLHLFLFVRRYTVVQQEHAARLQNAVGVLQSGSDSVQIVGGL